MARRAFCGIKKWWVFENRNLWFWNLDFPKLAISIFENWTFRVLLLLQKMQTLVEVSLVLSLVRKWGVHTDRQMGVRTSLWRGDHENRLILTFRATYVSKGWATYKILKSAIFHLFFSTYESVNIDVIDVRDASHWSRSIFMFSKRFTKGQRVWH